MEMNGNVALNHV